MNQTKNLTCIICPLGCSLEVKLINNEILNIDGATCKRGEKYVETELRNPVRTLTTTVKLINSTQKLLPVKSERPLPKSLIIECMEVINKSQISSPVKIGDVIIPNILDTGIDIVAAKNAS